jgi:sortase A
MFGKKTTTEDRLRVVRDFYVSHDPLRRARIWLEVALLVIGVTLVLAVGIEGATSYSSSQASLQKFFTSESAPPDSTSSFGADDAREQFRGNRSDLGAAVRVEGSLFSLTAITPLAVLQIPRLQVVAPVFNGTDDRTLRRGLGRIRGTALPGGSGNIGIAGHRDSFFRALGKIKRGDIVQLRTLQGTDIYVVDQITIVDPSAVDVLQPRSVSSITLVTCYPFHYIGSAPRRFIVQASLTQRKRSDGRGNLLAP